MSARPILPAGAIVTAVGGVVLLGWLFDVTTATSVMTGWRVMVPCTAASLVCAGVAIMLAASGGTIRSGRVAPRLFAVAACVLPAIAFVEHLTGRRTGFESWFGVVFDRSSDVAGRMSPLTSLCLLMLGVSLVAVTLRQARAVVWARVISGATLLTAWLAVFAVAFDTGRLADAPRFPGMAVMTIATVAVASWASLCLSFYRDPGPGPVVTLRTSTLLVAAFAIPLLFGALRDAGAAAISPQLMTAIFVAALALSMAAIIWRYAARIAELTRERARAFTDLEERVIERTHELAGRNEVLRRSEDRLRDADRRKDDFLATLAHELRNPLAPIRSAVAVLRAELVVDDDKREAQVIIERQVLQMARLVDDLLDVSRITAGKLQLQTQRLRLADVLNLAVSTVRPHVELARHRLIVSLPQEPIAVDGDGSRLPQVFANLLHNACKYTEPGGEIMLTVSLPNESEVDVAVRDNGIGIPPEFLPHLFQKFSQLASAHDRSQGGLGLGLSLVQGIVALHGGSVLARSGGSGRGSEFVVRLPVAQPVDVEVEARAAPAANVAALVSRRVLVVDDNADSAASMALLLRIEGHLVETAHNGETALVMAERFQPDAILLDIGMPRMSGYEVCESIRSRPWGRSILMVAQTGWGQAQDRARTRDAGFDAHLTKPIDPATVRGMLVSLKPVTH